MKKKTDRHADEQEKFSKRTMCKRMVIPGIIGGVIGIFFSLKWMLILAAIFALLRGIHYCEQFDD